MMKDSDPSACVIALDGDPGTCVIVSEEVWFFFCAYVWLCQDRKYLLYVCDHALESLWDFLFSKYMCDYAWFDFIKRGKLLVYGDDPLGYRTIQGEKHGG